MARKVFISVLGTGFYDACKYVKDGFISSETRYIQQATLEYLKVKNNWTTVNAEGDVIDRIVILLTNGAKGTIGKSYAQIIMKETDISSFPIPSIGKVVTSSWTCWRRKTEDLP